MSKSARQTKPDTRRAVRSNVDLVERPNSLGTHVCVQREAVGLGVQSDAPALVRSVVDSPGQPLDSETRSRMGPRFGYDFSGVRVHTDDRADESAKAVSAKAYTAGSHVAFATGRYAPNSQAGQQLIAHELTHVVQQASGPVAATQVAEGLSVSHPADRFEQAARRSSIPVGAGRAGGERPLVTLPTNQPAASQMSIQRADTDLSAAESHTAFGFGIGSAVGGLMSGISGIVSAYEAHRQADIAEAALGVSKGQLAEAKEQNVIGKEALGASLRQADAAEAQGTVVEGLTVTHASVADFNPDDKTSRKTDLIVPLLQMGIGGEDLAQYRLRLQIDEKSRIRGGTTEEEDAQGYVGGLAGSNASLTFSAMQESSKPDQLLIQFRGTNVAPKRKGIQRLHGEVKISAPKWQRDAQPLVSRPSDRNTKQANGPWALIPPYTPPTPQTQPVPTPKPLKKAAPSAPKKSGGGK